LEIYTNEAYKDEQWDEAIEKLNTNSIDCITFYSPSALKAFAKLIGREGIEKIILNKIPIAVIGSSTAKAAREENLYPEIMPSISDDENFVKALEEYFVEQE
jgi:uroporphyrinogen-III synthase